MDKHRANRYYHCRFDFETGTCGSLRLFALNADARVCVRNKKLTILSATVDRFGTRFAAHEQSSIDRLTALEKSFQALRSRADAADERAHKMEASLRAECEGLVEKARQDAESQSRQLAAGIEATNQSLAQETKDRQDSVAATESQMQAQLGDLSQKHGARLGRIEADLKDGQTLREIFSVRFPSFLDSASDPACFCDSD
jgi:hypothetical protein